MKKESKSIYSTDAKKRHNQLWKVCKNKASYLKWGWTAKTNKPDCSSGCKWFYPLEGDNGYDWGICCNSKSPRAGLLTFEHMGCKFFKL